jgi:hypothetical protein
MKKISIIGANISGLYNAIKYIDTDFIIDIYEKKNEIILDTSDNYIYNLYNDNHKNYINLLKKFNIKSIELDNIKFNLKIYNIINSVIDKIKLIPYNVRSSYTFLHICKIYLNSNEYEFIFKELNNNNILDNINASDFINIFTEDLSIKTKYYYVSNQDINLLISEMISLINKSQYINIYYNYKINEIDYNNKSNQFKLNNSSIYDYIICTLSKKNINEIKLWNNKNLNLLNNSVSEVNEIYIKNLIDNIININLDLNNIEKKNIIKNILLDNLHIIYPQNKINNDNIYLWNTSNRNDNYNFFLKEKIKFLFNSKFFICSLCYCKNNIFVNYLFESIDSTKFIKIKKKKK